MTDPYKLCDYIELEDIFLYFKNLKIAEEAAWDRVHKLEEENKLLKEALLREKEKSKSKKKNG